jgi:uncharacterized membrane protein YhhN
LLFFKTLASLLFIATVLLGYWHSHSNPVYFWLVFSALVFSLLGDVFLALPPKYIVGGLAMFSITHILYGITFATTFHPSVYQVIPALILSSVSCVFFNKIKSRLNELKILGVVYIVILNLMVISAFSSLWDPNTSVVKAGLIVVGSVVFFISDMFTGWDRFGKPFRIHYFEYILYYAAQLLLALSVVYS